MSWNPLRKLGSFRSPGQYHGSSLDQVVSDSEATELSLSNEDDALTSVDNSSKKMLKTAKRMTDALDSLSRVEVKLTTDLSNSSLCQQNPELRNLTEEWHSFNIRLTEESQDYVDTVNKTVIDPNKRINKMMMELRMALKAKEDLQCKIIKMKERVSKLESKVCIPGGLQLQMLIVF